MAKYETVSPNVSLEASMGNNSMMLSPNIINMSEHFKFLMPDKSYCRRSFSPSASNFCKSPNLSPIIKKNSPSESFLKRPNKRPPPTDKSRRLMCYNIPITFHEPNANLDETLSVKTVLKDLELSNYEKIFEREEIDLAAFFTLTEKDLGTIGITNEKHCRIIIDFISDFSTPKKAKKLLPKNYLYRH